MWTGKAARKNGHRFVLFVTSWFNFLLLGSRDRCHVRGLDFEAFERSRIDHLLQVGDRVNRFAGDSRDDAAFLDAQQLAGFHVVDVDDEQARGVGRFAGPVVGDRGQCNAAPNGMCCVVRETATCGIGRRAGVTCTSRLLPWR